MPKFKLTGDSAGATVLINNRYDFVDGELSVSKHDAQLLEPILCGYYGCVLEDSDEAEEIKEPASTSLEKTVTSPDAQVNAHTGLAEDIQTNSAGGEPSAASSAASSATSSAASSAASSASAASKASKASKASTQAE